MKTIALFNSRSGVGKSFLAYHLAWMFHHLGLRVVVADVDPQTHLTGAFLDDERCEELSMARPRKTILGPIEAASRSNIAPIPHIENIEGIEGFGLIAGDAALAGWEDRFSRAWYECLHEEPNTAIDALRTTTSFHTIAQKIGEGRNVDLLLLDLGPGLGAINRAALLAADAVIVPLAPEVSSRLALPTLGQAFRDWRTLWNDRRGNRQAADVALPSGAMPTIGYVVVQQAANMKQDVTRWHNEQAIAHVFHEDFLGEPAPGGSDPSCLAWLRHLRGLANLHLEARKPVFDLKVADGAIGSYAMAVKDAYVVFEKLAREIAKRAGLVLPEEQH